MDEADQIKVNGVAVPGVLMGICDSLDICDFHEKEIKYINLSQRASTGP